MEVLEQLEYEMEIAGVIEVGLKENCLIEYTGEKLYQTCLSCHAQRNGLLTEAEEQNLQCNCQK